MSHLTVSFYEGIVAIRDCEGEQESAVHSRSLGAVMGGNRIFDWRGSADSGSGPSYVSSLAAQNHSGVNLSAMNSG
jgi:hypothetical protein